MRKLRDGRVKKHAEDHAASKQQSWVLNPCLCLPREGALKPHASPTIQCLLLRCIALTFMEGLLLTIIEENDCGKPGMNMENADDQIPMAKSGRGCRGGNCQKIFKSRNK